MVLVFPMTKTLNENLIIDYLKSQPNAKLSPMRLGNKIVYKIGDIEIDARTLDYTYINNVADIKGYISFIKCPICNDIDIYTIYLCPNCNSQSLKKVDTLIHYECNYLDSVDKFLSKEGEYVCPRCKKILKTVGVDYGRPGLSYKCLNCNNITQFPLIKLLCSNNHSLKVDEVDFISYPIYQISKRAFEMDKIKRISELIKEMLMKENLSYTVLTYQLVRGISGVEHMIPIMIPEKQLYIDFILEEEEVQSSILSLLIKALDLPGKFIIIIKGRIDPRLINAFNVRNVEIVNIYVEEFEQVVINKVFEILMR